MNGRKVDTINVRDVEAVSRTISEMLSDKWITLLMPDAEVRSLAIRIVKELEEDRDRRR